MYVRIGQIAQALGVSTHLLKHYEKQGLIQPSKDEDSNYRYYDSRQCEKIIECKTYRNMGLTLKEIAQMMEEDAIVEPCELTVGQLEKIEEQMHHLEIMRQMTVRYQERCQEFDLKKNQWFLEMSPWLYFLPMSENDTLINRNVEEPQEGQLIDAVPLCQQMKYRDGKENVLWGLCIEKRDLEQLGYPVKPYYLEILPQRMVTVYLKIKVEDNSFDAVMEQVEQIYGKVEKENVVHSFLVIIRKEYKDGDEFNYIKLYLPIKHEC